MKSEEGKQTKVIISNLKDEMGQQEGKGTQCMFSNGICDHMSHGQYCPLTLFSFLGIFSCKHVVF